MAKEKIKSVESQPESPALPMNPAEIITDMMPGDFSINPVPKPGEPEGKTITTYDRMPDLLQRPVPKKQVPTVASITAESGNRIRITMQNGLSKYINRRDLVDRVTAIWKSLNDAPWHIRKDLEIDMGLLEMGLKAWRKSCKLDNVPHNHKWVDKALSEINETRKQRLKNSGD